VYRLVTIEGAATVEVDGQKFLRVEPESIHWLRQLGQEQPPLKDRRRAPYPCLRHFAAIGRA
jgi:hypothetical protein